MTNISAVRLRFAPSPTGKLHVGGLRTALFSYIMARQNDGQFLLRIEDTDRERLQPDAEQNIADMLDWAGLTPDESPIQGGIYAPYHQSKRLHLYHEAAEKLIETGHAYRCYTSSAELDELRQQQIKRGHPPRYDGRHRNLTNQQEQDYIAEGRKPVIRMRIPEKEERIVIDDLIRGKVVFLTSQLDDQVIIKSDGYPTYHLAVVVDDHAMQISHVMRAEEWLPSTPKHVCLYRWLGYPLPKFAHLPLLLNEDRSKMSKRKGDVAVEDYKNKGYLPEALINFLALMGWSTGDTREVMPLADIIKEFSVKRITKSGAIFDRSKLEWMNQQYIQKLSLERLYELSKPFITELTLPPKEQLKPMLEAVQPSLTRLDQLNEKLSLFTATDTKLPASPQLDDPQLKELCQFLLQFYRTNANDDYDFKALMKNAQQHTGLKGQQLWKPVRIIFTHAEEGPDLTQTVRILGAEKIIQRLEQAMDTLFS